MRRLLTLGFLLIIPAVVGAEPHVQIVEPKPRPVYTRDLVSVYAAKAFALDTLNRYPANTINNVFSGTNNFTGLVTFGSAAGAANSINFGTVAGCLQYEGSVSDTFEFDLCVGAIDQDASLTYTVSGTILTITPVPTATTYAGSWSLASGRSFLAANGHYSLGTGGNAYFIGGNQTTPAIYNYTIGTPDSAFIGTGPASNSYHFGEAGDVGFDYQNGRAGTIAAGDPTLIIQSRNQVTGSQYLQFSSQNATGAGEIQTDRTDLVVGATKFNFTEGGVVIAKVTLPSSGMYGAEIVYTVTDDATDFIARAGSILVQGVNKAGVTTCTISASRNTELTDGSSAAVSGGALTLTYTWTNVANGTSCDLTLSSASSAGANTNDIIYTMTVNGTSSAITVTPQ